MRAETFKVTGVTRYETNIRRLATENEDYHLRDWELEEQYFDGDRIYELEFDPNKVELIPDPDNPVDENAVRVEIDGLMVGYIKKGSCTHVKKLLASPDFLRVGVKSMGMGRYKQLYEDEDGELQVEEGEYDYCWVHIRVFLATPEDKAKPDTELEMEATTVTEPQTSEDNPRFVPFSSLETVQKDNSPSMQRTNTAPRFDSQKLKTGPLSKQKTPGNASKVWGIVLYAFGMIYIPTSVPVGLLLCAVSIGLLWNRSMKLNPEKRQKAPIWVIVLIIVALVFGLFAYARK